MQITDQTGRSMGNRRGVAAMVCCGVIAASAGLVATLTSFNGDAVIARGFERAFASIANQAAPAPAFDGVAGTEDDWLRSTAGNGIVKAVAIGEVIHLSDNGTERRLTITNVRDAGDAATHIDTSPVSSRVLLIACREGDEASHREIRLKLEGGRISVVAADPISSAL